MKDMRDDTPHIKDIYYFDKLYEDAPKAKALLEQAKAKEAKIRLDRAQRKLEKSIIFIDLIAIDYQLCRVSKVNTQQVRIYANSFIISVWLPNTG